MNAGAELPFLKKSALFERLALGAAAGVTVVTPNKRLSQALMLEFDAFQIGKALSVWEAPDILPFGAFVQRLYEGGLYADLSAELPMLLTPAQEEELWKQVVGKAAAPADDLLPRPPPLPRAPKHRPPAPEAPLQVAPREPRPARPHS